MNLKNLALGYVKTAPSPATTGTSLTLETGEGARFPETTTESFYVTLMPADVNPHSENAEVVEVTDRTGDVLTIVRGQRGTTGKTVAVGWIVLNSVYKEDLDDLKGSNSFIFSETPTGDVDGVNDTFTLANTPTTNTLQLFRDGQLLKGGGVDYTLTGDEIVFTSAPELDSILLAHYHKVAVGSGNADTLDGLDSTDFATITGTETLTNKTLTSPLYQGLIDGWVSANETWTYASATTFTISGDLTSKYQKGDKIKFTQATDGVKYMYIYQVIESGGTTTIYVTGGSDYNLDNEAITANYYSKIASPQGFPAYFNTSAPSFSVSTIDNGSGGQPTVTSSIMKIMNRDQVRLQIKLSTAFKAGTGKLMSFTIPTECPIIGDGHLQVVGNFYIGTLDDVGIVIIKDTDEIYFFRGSDINDNTDIGGSTIDLTYRFA